MRVWVLTNLKRKFIREVSVIDSYEREWEGLKTKGPDIATSGDLKWTFVTDNEFSLSFIRCETVLYDDKRVLSDSNFTRSDTNKKIEVSMKYHQREVPAKQMENILSQFGSCV